MRPRVEVCPVLLPGREARISEPPYITFDSLAEALTRELSLWLDAPYAIFGHSMGALLAFECARRLHSENRALPLWLFVSGRCAPDVEPGSRHLHMLPDNDFLLELRRTYEGIPTELSQNREVMEFYLPILRADISVVESYRFRESVPLGCPITVFAGITDGSVTRDQLLGWQRHTLGDFELRYLPGGHFIPDQALLDAVSTTLTQISL